MTLTNLPSELLYLICDHLYSLADLYALMCTCSQLHRIASTSTARLPPILGRQDKYESLPLHPWTLYPTMAIHLVRWAAESEEQNAKLEAALSSQRCIFNLACEVMRMSFAQVRYAYMGRPWLSKDGNSTAGDGLIDGQQFVVPSFVIRSTVYVNHREGLKSAEWDGDTRLERKILDLLRYHTMGDDYSHQKTLATSRKVDLMKRARRRELAARSQ